MNQVMRIVKDEELQILNQNFDTNCTLTFEVRKANLNPVLAKLEKVEGIVIKYLKTV
jgi:putative IMPACT (imprinted ancient) family translation regulator